MQAQRRGRREHFGLTRRLSCQSSTRLATAEATHESILRMSLLTPRRSVLHVLAGNAVALQAAAKRRGSGMLVARQEGTEQGAGDLRELCQRRVALERVCRGARGADLVTVQAAARRGGSGMLNWAAGRDPTYFRVVSVALLLSGFAAAPASSIWLVPRLQRGEEGQGCSWRDRATRHSAGRARLSKA